MGSPSEAKQMKRSMRFIFEAMIDSAERWPAPLHPKRGRFLLRVASGIGSFVMSGEFFCDDIDNADTEDHADTEVSVMVRILVFAGA